MTYPAAIKLTLVNSLDALADIEAAINEICTLNNVERTSWHRCRLVAEELFVNIVKHGFDEGVKGLIEWNIWIGDDEIHFDIYDNGREFTPNSPKPLPTSLNEIDDVGGHGTGLIEMMTKSIEYSRENLRNRCLVAISVCRSPHA